MIRRHLLLPLLLAASSMAVPLPATTAQAAARSPIVTQPAANRHGLVREWFAQVQLDRTRGRVTSVTLGNENLYVQTDQGVVHAIRLADGQTRWAVKPGVPDHPTLPLGFNKDLVATINGSYLYVLNRYNGKLLWKHMLDGAPGGGAAVSENWVFVPMINGLVMAYQLKPSLAPLVELGKAAELLDPEDAEAAEAERRESLRLRQGDARSLACQSFGRAFVQPVVARENEGEVFVAWPTDRGILFVGNLDRRSDQSFTLKYQLQTEAGIAAAPAYLPPDPDDAATSGILFVASRDGVVHALREKNGTLRWRFPTNEPLIESPVVLEGHVYVTTQPGGMYSLDATTGAEQWWTPEATQFVAASNARVYATDKVGRLLILDRKTGGRLDSMNLVHNPIKVCNTRTDRIYLATETGLIQSLHEIELSDPLQHSGRAAPEEEAPADDRQPGEPQQDDPPGDDQPAPQFDNPFAPGGGEQPAEPAEEEPADDNPFAAGDDNPFAAGDDNPFD